MLHQRRVPFLLTSWKCTTHVSHLRRRDAGTSVNVARYDTWHEYFRARQPRTLIVWGKNDPFFTVAGARAFQRDLPQAELHLLDAGHFALEEESDFIAQRITAFLS